MSKTFSSGAITRPPTIAARTSAIAPAAARRVVLARGAAAATLIPMVLLTRRGALAHHLVPFGHDDRLVFRPDVPVDREVADVLGVPGLLGDGAFVRNAFKRGPHHVVLLQGARAFLAGQPVQ